MLSNDVSGYETDFKQILHQIRMLAVQIHQSLELSEILNIIVAEVRKTLESDRVVIYRFLPDGDGVIAEESVSGAWKPILGQLIYDPCFNTTWVERYQEGQINIIEDIDTKQLDPCYKKLLMGLQIRANLVVPILINSQKNNGISSTYPHLWGLLIAHQCSSPRQWSSLETEYLQLVAAELGIALGQIKWHQRLATPCQSLSTTQVANQIDRETLRSIEALCHTTLMISLYTMDGLPLMQNPAALRCYGGSLHANSSTENTFLSHFVDKNVGQQAIEVINLGEMFSIETQVFTNQGIRWHCIDTQCTRDPVTGNSTILVNEKDITKQQAVLQERQRAESELLWREALLRSMTDTSLLGFFVVDNGTDEILYFNHRFCEIWGIEHLEAQMRLGALKNNDIIPDCIPSIADVPAFAQSCKPLQSQENRCTIEDEILFVDGRTIRRFSSQIRDTQDRYFGRLYIFEDITERKQIEAALKASEERWQYALEGNGDGVWDWNVQTNEVFFSRRWKEMLGFAEHEIGNILSEWDQRVHSDDKPRVYEEINKHFRGETQQYVSEHRVRCKDGTYKWILDRGQIFSRADNGLPLRMLGTHTDITERKRMEEALRSSEQRYRSVITAMAEGIVLQKADGRITACNESAERILGLTADQMMGRSSIDPQWKPIHEDGTSFPGETHPAIVTLHTGQPQFNVVMGVHKPDSSLSWISINSQPLFKPDESQPYAVVASFTDITVRKQAELALRQQAERERMISAIAQHMHQSLDLDEILNTTVAEVRQFLQTDRVIIYRFNRDWSGLVVTESVTEGWQSLLNIEITDSYIVEKQGQFYQQTTLKATSDIYTAGLVPCHIELLEQLQVRAKLVVPILQGDGLWGLLIAHHCSAPREWQPWEEELLQQLATQVAIAIQ
ncbi:GAF domain-containing protein, partial [Nostoc sp. CALU 546]